MASMSRVLAEEMQVAIVLVSVMHEDSIKVQWLIRKRRKIIEPYKDGACSCLLEEHHS